MQAAAKYLWTMKDGKFADLVVPRIVPLRLTGRKVERMMKYTPSMERGTSKFVQKENAVAWRVEKC